MKRAAALGGPVVAAAVILDAECIPGTTFSDARQTRKRILRSNCHYGIGVADRSLDRDNIAGSHGLWRLRALDRAARPR
jgi:hypothetical protein